MTPTLNLIIRSGLDSDALAFAAESGAEDRRGLSDFARGVKGLGLWDSMVCWPLRSSQNAGTGTDVYSLGGGGSFPGTLVNGPTWGADYMTATSTQKATISNLAFTSNDVMFITAVKSDTGKVKILKSINAVFALFAPSVSTAYFDATEIGARISAAFGTRTAFSFVGGIGGAENSIRKDAAQLVAGGVSDISGESDDAVVFEQTDVGTSNIAFVAVFQGQPYAAADFNAVRALYKSTIGIGLSLP